MGLLDRMLGKKIHRIILREEPAAGPLDDAVPFAYPDGVFWVVGEHALYVASMRGRTEFLRLGYEEAWIMAIRGTGAITIQCKLPDGRRTEVAGGFVGDDDPVSMLNRIAERKRAFRGARA